MVSPHPTPPPCLSVLYLGLVVSQNGHADRDPFSFLENIHRISEPDYLPVMGMHDLFIVIEYHLIDHNAGLEDILHVRLQTLGVTEHSFDITIGGSQLHWLMYDVGGAVRSSLYPFRR